MATAVPLAQPTDETFDDLLRRHAAAHPDEPAVADPPDLAAATGRAAATWTWAHLDQHVDRLAGALAAHGIRHGDAVAVQLPESTDLVRTLLACWRLGAAVVPLDERLRDRSVTYRATRTCAAAMVTTARVGTLRPAAAAVALPCFRTVLAWGPGVPGGAVDLDAAETTGAAPGPRAVHVRTGDRAAVLWTGCERQLPYSHRELAESTGYLVPWLHEGGHLRLTGSGRIPPL